MSIFTKTSSSGTKDPTKINVILRNKVVDESEKFAESLKKQITGVSETKSTGNSNLVHDIITHGGTVNPVLDKDQQQSIVAQDKRRLAELEAEMRNFRMQREQQTVEYSKKVEDDFGATSKHPTSEQLVMPSSPRKGPKGTKGKGQPKGSGEMLKSKK